MSFRDVTMASTGFEGPTHFRTFCAVCVARLANTADGAPNAQVAHQPRECWSVLMSIAIEENEIRPLGIVPEHVSLVCLLVSAIWAAITCFKGWPGTAVAASYLLPFALMVWEAKQAPRNRSLNSALLCAAVAVFGVVMEPGWFNMVVAWGLLMAASLLLRKDQAMNAITVACNALVHAITSPFHFILGLPLVGRLSVAIARKMPPLPFATVALPVVASVVFLCLLAVSNPIIADVVSNLAILNLDALLERIAPLFSPWGIFIGLVATLLLWPVLQRNARVHAIHIAETGTAPLWHQVFFKPTAVAATLILMNLLFGLQNALDIKYVWLTDQLPFGVSYAQYAQKGAYSLIVTVLLAAVFVVFALRKNTPAAASKNVRALVYIWIAQNAALVASSVWRTLNYISEFGWTELRVSALIWMGLVCFGLASVVWRVWKNSSVLWLINTNIAAAAVLLALCAPLDVKGFVTAANVNRALKDKTYSFDFLYTQKLGVNTLPALQDMKKRLATRVIGSDYLESATRLSALSSNLDYAIRLRKHEHYILQNDWRTWSLRRAFMMITP